MANDHLHCGHGALAALAPAIVAAGIGLGVLLALNPGMGFGALAVSGGAVAILGAGSFGAGFLVTLWILLLVVGGLVAVVVILLRQPAALVQWILDRFPLLKLFLSGVYKTGDVIETSGTTVRDALDRTNAGLQLAIQNLRDLSPQPDQQPWKRVADLPNKPFKPLKDAVAKLRESINASISALEDAHAQVRKLAADQATAGGNLKTAAKTLDSRLPYP